MFNKENFAELYEKYKDYTEDELIEALLSTLERDNPEAYKQLVEKSKQKD